MKELPEIIARSAELPEPIRFKLEKTCLALEKALKRELLAAFAYQLKEHARLQRELEVTLIDELTTEGDFA